MLSLILGFFILSYVFYRLYEHFFPSAIIKSNGKYVLISGCDTGFGHDLAIQLDRRGFHVLAGVYLSNNIIMTKKCLPLLITKHHSRVINITSIAGFIASPNFSAYSASKFAFEAFSDCLRREMHPWGLHVCIIEPSFMRTPILRDTNKLFEDLWSTVSEHLQKRWGEVFAREQCNNRDFNVFIKYAEDPMKAVKAFEHAVMNSNPRIRYRPGWQASLLFFPLSMLSASIVDWILINGNKSVSTPARVFEQLKD